MKEYRVIFCLTNGKRKYATHNGEILLWDDYDLLALHRNLLDYEQFAFTDDFAYFDFSAEALRGRFPEAGILRVKGFRTEDPSLPVNPDIIR